MQASLTKRIADSKPRLKSVEQLRKQINAQPHEEIPYLMWTSFLMNAANGKTPEHHLWVQVIARAISDAHFDKTECAKRQAELIAMAEKREASGNHVKYLAYRSEARMLPKKMNDDAREAREFLCRCDNVLEMIGIDPEWFRETLKKHTAWAA